MNRNMTKRILSLVLTLALLLSNFPMAVFATESHGAENSYESTVNSATYGEGTIYPDMDETQKSIDEQIRSYAKSLDFSGADDVAALALAMHGITGRGKHLKMGEDHALAATLMNSEMGLSTVIRGCIMVIAAMQHNGMASAVNDGGCNYDTELPIYYTNVFPNDSFNRDECLYNAGASIYSGSFNSYDDSLMWMSGSTEIHMYFTRGTVTADSITYDVTVKFTDRFDFDSDSSSVPEAIASLIGSILFRGFNWTATVAFQVTAPNLCTHQSSSYHLTYDAGEQQITAEVANEFDQNGAQKLQYHHLYAPDSTYRTFYQLNRAIHLRHDRPWVLEYTKTDPDALSLAQVNVQSSARPYFYHASEIRHLFIPVLNRLPDETAQIDYYGILLENEFQYQADNSYRIRLENVPENDGKNTIFLTIYNNMTQETVLQSTPMNDCYSLKKKDYILKIADSDGLDGMDFVISYIGDTSFSFDSTVFDLKVWENGENGEAASYFQQTKVTAPTCMEQGCTIYTCDHCGYAYEESIPATGHNYEAVVTEPTCREGGCTTYTCSNCGDSYIGDHTEPVDHSYEDGVCIWCGAEETLVQWYSGSTSLNGTIDLNMYVILSENLVNDPETFVRFTFENRQVDVPMADALVHPLKDGRVTYRFTCPLFAKQVADSVLVQVMRGETPVGEPKAYSAMQYCKNLINKNEDPKAVAMCKAMLNYAAAAQLLFNYNTENLANESLSEEDKNLPTVDVSAYKYTVINNEPGIRARGATMMMESEIRIRVYFALDAGRTIDEYTFTIDDVEVEPEQNDDGMWYIESAGIVAKEMEEMHEFKCGGITVTYGALSYVNSKLTDDDPLTVNLAKALYAYYIAAENLFG